jgi:hypothetical protein
VIFDMPEASTRSSQEDVSDSFGRPRGYGRRGLNQPNDASVSAASDLDSRPGLRRNQAERGQEVNQSIDSPEQMGKVVAGERAKVRGNVPALPKDAAKQRKNKNCLYNGR